MLVLSRKENEKIIIDGKIEVEVLHIGEGKVKIGVSAPKEVEIHRGEVYEAIKESNKSSVTKDIDMTDLKNIFKK